MLPLIFHFKHVFNGIRGIRMLKNHFFDKNVKKAQKMTFFGPKNSLKNFETLKIPQKVGKTVFFCVIRVNHPYVCSENTNKYSN